MSGTMLITNGTVIDGTGRAPFAASVLIEDGRVAAVGETADARASQSRDATRLDAAGMTVMPGLIDTHCHLSFDDAASNAEIFFHRRHGLSAIVAAANGRKLLRAGVTGLLDPDSVFETMVDVRDAIDAGVIEGPRIACGAYALITGVGGTAGRLISDEGVTGYYKVVRDKAEIVSEVRRQIKVGADWIKVHVTGIVPRQAHRGEMCAWSSEELRLICDTAHDLGTPVMGHCRGADATRKAAEAGFDLLFHATGMDERALESVVERRIPISPAFTFQANMVDFGHRIGTSPALVALFEREITDSAEMLTRAYRAGVPLLCGSEAGFTMVPYGDWHYREMEVFVRYLGLSPLEAIQCGTQAGAVALRLEGGVGTVASGQLADIICVAGDPSRGRDDPGRARPHSPRDGRRPHDGPHAAGAAQADPRLDAGRHGQQADAGRGLLERACRDPDAGVRRNCTDRRAGQVEETGRMITVDTYREAEGILRLPDLRQGLYDEGAVLMRDVLVNLHGSEHRRRRTLETRVFRRDFFRYYEREVFPRTLRRTLAPFLRRGSADLVDLGYRVTLNLTADFTGIDRPLQTPEETEASAAAVAQLRQGCLALPDARRQGGGAAGDRNRDGRVRCGIPCDLGRAPPRLVLERFARGEIQEQDLPRDVLLVLLRNEDKVELTPEMLLRETGFFLMAGALTSIHSMTHAMHEILAWCAVHPEDRARIADDRLFVQRCVYESMRLHPSSPTAGRRATCPMRLPGGEALAQEDRVVVDLIAANKDREVFGDDAPHFNPHRPVPSGEYGYGLSFGLGMHACLGRNLAAGVPAGAGADPENHHYGSVTLIVAELLAHHARPNPEQAPRPDVETGRPNWASYPILLEDA